MKLYVRLKLIFCFALIVSSAHAQINVTPSQTAAQLAQMLTGNGVVVTNPTLNCPMQANGLFFTVASNLGLDSGIILTSGRAQTMGTLIGANGAGTLFASNNNNAAGDPQLAALAGQTSNDACVLEFDFQPSGDTIKFDYVFGSDEYTTYNCSINDMFAFFISGPGIVGQKNIALVPGTTVPVAISTINNGSGYTASPSNPCYVNTLGNGPYTQYYVTNSGTSVTYNGFTTVLSAISAVTPCTTYHLKLAISDASDYILDSGVFLKAGSLTSNAISVSSVGGGGLSLPTPYCVRGGLPGQFKFKRPAIKPTPLTIKYLIAGTAINGTDYTQITDSVIIPANDTVAFVNIFPLPAVPPTGPRTVKLLILAPYNCGISGNVIDSASLIILDSIYAIILTPDTLICKNSPVNIRVDGDSLLSYTWTPALGLNNPNIKEPTAIPLTTTTYKLTATFPGSGAPPAIRYITITVKPPASINAGADRAFCLGNPIQFNPTISPPDPNYVFTWFPATGLSSSTILNPVCNATGNTTYIIRAENGIVGCEGYDTVKVRVLPNDFSLFNNDTAICKGATVQINAAGDTAFTYVWTPSTNVSNPLIIAPAITPDTTRTYTVTASFPGCPNMVKTINIDVQPNPIVYVGPDRIKCQWDTLQIQGIVTPNWYPNYTYSWTPTTGVNLPNAANIIFNGEVSTGLQLVVTTPAGCSGSDDLQLTVNPGNFASISPIDPSICPGDSVQYTITGGVLYDWSPSAYLSATDIANPVSHPPSSIAYSVLVTDITGCRDTLSSKLTVNAKAVFDLKDSVHIYPGESTTVNPSGNCLYFNWFPLLGLSNHLVSNPIISPSTSTKYIVNAKTEAGCVTTDTLDVIVHDDSAIDFPNAFTPGSDPNAKIKIVYRGIVSLKNFRIFNRWGELVFETTKLEDAWDGTKNGVPQPMGVYIYMVEANTYLGKRFYKQGNITLIR
ncbi:MAG: choice-of-anchor L domain-containing protein [Bacteroidota bacterium]|jgi:gliding motility-associated-like protein